MMFRQMIAENPFEFSNDPTTFDKLVRAQHYGLPTRLLDVSVNPLVGLYFACCSSLKVDGKVLIIKTSKQKHRYFDSDTISLLANLAFLNRSEKEGLLEFAKENVKSDVKSERIEQFKECKPLDRLIQTLKAEKSHFRAEVDPWDLVIVVSVTPKKSHERIKAQDGQFLIFGTREDSKGPHLGNIELDELVVVASAKEEILHDLALLGVSEKTMFPEIDKTAMQLKKKYS